MNKKQTGKEKKNTEIEPIRSQKHVDKVRAILSDNPRDLLLFDFAIQTGIGMKQILTLKAKDLWGIEAGGRLNAGIIKRNDLAGLIVSDSLYNSWQNFLLRVNPSKGDYLFKSRKGNRPLNISSVSSMIKSWFQKADLPITGGAKSLQKTWAFHYKKEDKISKTESAQVKDPVSSINPVKVETVKDKVYRELSRAIFSGRLAPGERLLESKIAEQMNVSRMPVREALHRLQEAGFVSPNKNFGKVVNQLSRESLEEITRIRIILETEAARKATKNRTQQTLKRLEEINSQLVKAVEKNDIDKVLHLNKQFHTLICEDANMPILQQIIGSLWDRVSPYVHILMREGDAQTSAKEVKVNHQAMLKGFRRKDPNVVCKWIKADLVEGKHMVYDLLDKWGIE